MLVPATYYQAHHDQYGRDSQRLPGPTRSFAMTVLLRRDAGLVRLCNVWSLRRSHSGEMTIGVASKPRLVCSA